MIFLDKYYLFYYYFLFFIYIFNYFFPHLSGEGCYILY